MFDAGKFFAGRAADALRGRFGRDEIGKFFFQLLQLAEKLVVFAVGDKLPAFDVIGVVVPADFGGEFGVAFFGFGVCHAEMINARRAERQFLMNVTRLFLAQKTVRWTRRIFAGERRGVFYLANSAIKPNRQKKKMPMLAQSTNPNWISSAGLMGETARRKRLRFST